MKSNGINIVLITIDCFRTDALPNMPFLNELASKGITFSNAFAPSTCTYFSMPTLMTGRLPLSSRNLGIRQRELTIAQFLNTQGYHTVGLVAANPWLSRYYGYDKGFEYFHDFIFDDAKLNNNISSKKGISVLRRIIKKADIFLGSRSRAFAKALLKKITRKDFASSRINVRAETLLTQLEVKLTNFGKDKHPIFLWLHFMDLHEPYFLGETSTLKELYLNSLVHEAKRNDDKALFNFATKELLTLYFKIARSLDQKIHELFSLLKKVGLSEENTAFFITGDHGQEFGEGGFLYHHTAKSFVKELTKVPLILRLPTKEKLRIESPVSLTYLKESLLEASRLSYNKTVDAFMKKFINVVRPLIPSLNGGILRYLPSNSFKEIRGTIIDKNGQFTNYFIDNLENIYLLSNQHTANNEVIAFIEDYKKTIKKQLNREQIILKMRNFQK